MRVLLVALGALLPLHVSFAQEAPPRLDLVMKPHATGGEGSHIAVTMTIETPDLKEGDGLVHLPLILVGIPSARYDGDALTARDDEGPIPLMQAEEPPTPQGVYRRWNVGRDTVGDVTVRYNAPPRKVTAATNNGPLFDLREEAGGFAGAGVGFIATPVAPGPYSVNLKWNLTEAPEGAFGVWSLGEGDVQRILPSPVLSFSYYMVGPLKRYPAPGEESDFALYWLGEPPFEIEMLAERIGGLHAAMTDFFKEETSDYRVFIRQNPYKGRGGSALSGSFMFGYNVDDNPSVDELQGLLAHEMAHNWPAMEGEHGDTAWYSEGMAEYYSTLLAYRAGLSDLDEYLKDINDKARAYFANPFIALSNAEAAEKFWTDPIAQTVPYGRGFMYLVATDGAIRKATRGKRSLDDIVVEMRRRQNEGEPYGVPEWLSLVSKEIGKKKAQTMFDAMAGGAFIAADAQRFAPCFGVEEKAVRPLELGFARSSLNDERIVKDLVEGSAAARAGVREGDRITKVEGYEEARRDEEAEVTLTIARDSGETTVTYLPRGEEVAGFQWTKNPKADAKACKL